MSLAAALSQRRALARPVLLTFASEAASVVSTVWVTRRIATAYPGAEVAAYLVLRQVLNWVLGVGLMGLNVSLPRALAAAPDPAARARRLAAALVVAAPVILLLLAAPAVAPGLLARVILHDAGAAALMAPACALIAANGLFGLGAAALQGLDRFGALALGRVVAFGVGPIAVAGLLGARVGLPRLLLAWSAATLAVDLAVGVVVLRALDCKTVFASDLPRGDIRTLARSLVGYGGPRMIGAIAQIATVALAPSLSLWCGADRSAAAALSVGAMFGVVLGPVRLALQPIGLTRLAAITRADEALRLVRDYVAASALAAVLLGAPLVALGPRVVALWLGPAMATRPTLLRAAVAAAVLHFFCYALEGVLDAHDPRHRRPAAQLLAALAFAALAAACALGRAGAAGVAVAQLLASVFQTVLYLRLCRPLSFARPLG